MSKCPPVCQERIETMGLLVGRLTWVLLRFLDGLFHCSRLNKHCFVEESGEKPLCYHWCPVCRQHKPSSPIYMSAHVVWIFGSERDLHLRLRCFVRKVLG